MRKGRLLLLVGLPLSGKSTLVSDWGWDDDDDFLVVSSDEERKYVTGSYNNFTKEETVWLLVGAKILDGLKRGKIVVLDSTNTTIQRRARWLHLYNDYPIYCISLLPKKLNYYLDRLDDREEKPMPKSAMEAMYVNYQKLTNMEKSTFRDFVETKDFWSLSVNGLVSRMIRDHNASDSE